MTEEKSQVDILKGEPKMITLFGKDFKVMRMTYAKQEQAMALISECFSDQGDGKAHIEKIGKLALLIVAHATGIQKERIRADGSLIETLVAFKVIWKQNGFDFLAKTVADLTAGMTS